METSKGRRYYQMPSNSPFNDARDVILMSRNDVRGMNDDDDDNKMSIFTIKRH